jgi:copper transport protein
VVSRSAPLIVLLALLALPAAAGAHAVVEETQPVRAAALERSPERVAVTFDEPVESSFGALRVFDREGGRVDRGELLRPSGERIAVRLDDDLPDGAYTATYSVVSADAHPVSGGFSFTVGDAAGAPAAAVDELLDDASAGPVTNVAFGLARAVGYAAIALLAGGCAFLLLVWLPVLRGVARPPRAAPTGGAPPGAAPIGAAPVNVTAGADPLAGADDGSPSPGWRAAAAAFERRTGSLLLAAALAGLAATAAGIVLQAATVTGGTFWSALDGGLLHDVLNTRFGDVWKLRFTAFGVLAALLLFPHPSLGADALAGRRPRIGAARAAAFALALAYLVVSPALGGHAGADEQAELLVPLDVVHVAAMSAWIGGVALLALAVPVATGRLGPGDRTRLLAELVTRFSTVALTAVAALLASGVAQSILQLESLSDLVDSAFGRAILVKSAIFLALVALGAHNRRRSQPRLREIAAGGGSPGRAGVVLRRALRSEVVLMAAVLAVTAALVSYSPPSGVQTGPYADSADLGPARMELTVDPATAGANEIHLYLFDARTGAQYDRARELTVTASQRELRIGPLKLRPRKAGPGHYTVTRAELAPAGDWTIAVRARISDFEELRGELDVPIR